MADENTYEIRGLSEEVKELAMERKPVGMTWDEFLRETFTGGVPVELTDAQIDAIATRTAERTLAGLARPPYWSRDRDLRPDGGFETLADRR